MRNNDIGEMMNNLHETPLETGEGEALPYAGAATAREIGVVAQSSAPVAAIDDQESPQADLNGYYRGLTPSLYDAAKDLLTWIGAKHRPPQHDICGTMAYVRLDALATLADALHAAPQQHAQAEDAEESAHVIMRQGQLLAGVAIALKGEENARGHSNHDLPELAAKMALELEVYRQQHAQAALSDSELPPLHAAAQNVVSQLNDPHVSLASVARYVNELAEVLAASQPAPVTLTPMGEAGNEWYFDCDGHYIDVKRDEGGKYSVYFRNRKDGIEAWHDQADIAPVAAAAQGDDIKKLVSHLDRFVKLENGGYDGYEHIKELRDKVLKASNQGG